MEELNKEKQQLIEELTKMDTRRREITLRLAEIQGVEKYLAELGKKGKEEK